MKPLKKYLETDDIMSYHCATLEQAIRYKQEQLNIIRAATRAGDDTEMKELESKFEDLYVIDEIVRLENELMLYPIDKYKKMLRDSIRIAMITAKSHSRYYTNLCEYGDTQIFILSKMKDLIESRKLYEDEDLFIIIAQRFFTWLKSALEDTKTSLQKSLDGDRTVSNNLESLEKAIGKINMSSW